jgi:hypothetical protein
VGPIDFGVPAKPPNGISHIGSGAARALADALSQGRSPMRLPSEQPAYGFLLDAIWTARSTGELERFRALAFAHYKGKTRQTLVQLIDDRAHRLPQALERRARWLPDPAPPRAASGNG